MSFSQPSLSGGGALRRLCSTQLFTPLRSRAFVMRSCGATRLPAVPSVPFATAPAQTCSYGVSRISPSNSSWSDYEPARARLAGDRGVLLHPARDQLVVGDAEEGRKRRLLPRRPRHRLVGGGGQSVRVQHRGRAPRRPRRHRRGERPGGGAFRVAPPLDPPASAVAGV